MPEFLITKCKICKKYTKYNQKEQLFELNYRVCEKYLTKIISKYFFHTSFITNLDKLNCALCCSPHRVQITN